ncbi:MAG: hypothetical protein MJ014_01065 [Methanocorpusculum sp.]|nr:hypothetical protein [Methanocorpusculum sp.]
MQDQSVLLHLCLAAVAAVLCSAGCVTTVSPAGAVVVTQTNGEVFTLDHPAERIVLMNSNAAEMLYVMGAADKVSECRSRLRIMPSSARSFRMR